MNAELKQVMEKLNTIKIELDFVKKHMVDVDCIMTKDDFLALKSYEEEKVTKKLISHEQLKKELE